MLHEIFHIIYDEQSLPVKENITGWFKNNQSPCSNYAYLIMNEALATVLGNGYVYAQLNGQTDTTDWYNQKYINLMAQKIYPLVVSYIAEKRPMDKQFVNAYIDIYQRNFFGWLKELSNLMTYRYVLSGNDDDFNIFAKEYPYISYAASETTFSPEKIQEMNSRPVTKLVIVSNNHSNKLLMIKNGFEELQNWSYDPDKEFTYHIFLRDKTELIIINQFASGLNSLLDKTFNN